METQAVNGILPLNGSLAAVLLFFLFVFGCCMGSFLNCAAWRSVHGESVLRGRSHCDECGHVLGFVDLIPVVSFLLSRGCCRYCGVSLSRRHLWCELAAGVLFAVIGIKFGISLQALEALLLACVLLLAAFVDLEGYIIPDRCIVSGIVVHLVFVFIGSDVLHGLIQALLGAVSVAGVLLLIVLAMEKLSGREMMGGGDIKLLALTGWFLGWQRNVLCLLLACVLGIVFALLQKRADGEAQKLIPWGPSIAAASLFSLLWGSGIINRYLGLF